MSRISLFALSLCALVAWASADDFRYDLKKAPELFKKFQEDFNRVYENAVDKAVHYAAFVENLKNINERNEKNPQARYRIDKMADYTKYEFEHHKGFNMTASARIAYKNNISAVGMLSTAGHRPSLLNLQDHEGVVVILATLGGLASAVRDVDTQKDTAAHLPDPLRDSYCIHGLKSIQTFSNIIIKSCLRYFAAP